MGPEKEQENGQESRHVSISYESGEIDTSSEQRQPSMKDVVKSASILRKQHSDIHGSKTRSQTSKISLQKQSSETRKTADSKTSSLRHSSATRVDSGQSRDRSLHGLERTQTSSVLSGHSVGKRSSSARKEKDDSQDEIRVRLGKDSVHQIKGPSGDSKLSLTSPSLLGVTQANGSRISQAGEFPRSARQSPRQSVTPDAEAATIELLGNISPQRIKSYTKEKSFLFTKRKSFERPSRISALRPSSISSFQRVTEFDRTKIIRYMNTYRLDPKFPFKPDPVREILKEILEKELESLKYDPVQCATQCLILSADIRNRVKLLGFDRHKLICTVEIGERKNQSIFSGVRFLWDPERDNFAFYRYENTYISALACVYGVYYE